MPEVKKQVTMSPIDIKPPRLNWWDLWARKWTGGGLGGSALWRPSEWLNDPIYYGGRGFPTEEPPPDTQMKEWYNLSPEEQQAALLDLASEPFPSPVGYQWQQVSTDESGYPVQPRWSLVSDKKPEGDIDAMAPYEQSPIDLAWAEHQRQLAQDIWQRKQASRPQDNTQLQSMQWELDRVNALNQLTQPSDWITRWRVQNAPNPHKQTRERTGTAGDYEYQQLTPEQSREMGVSQMGTFVEAPRGAGAPIYENQFSAPNAGIGRAGLGEPALRKEAIVGWTPYVPRESKQKSRQKAPSAPQWLPQFVPSQFAGRPITPSAVRTPSAQQLSATPWSVREGLRGYTEYAGGRSYQDILDEISMMLPEQPSGVSGKSWRPSRQR